MTARAQLRWRCRRGMRELDVLLGRWLETHYDAAAPTDQAAFRALLERPDPELYAWLLGTEQPEDPALARLVEVISGPG